MAEDHTPRWIDRTGMSGAEHTDASTYRRLLHEANTEEGRSKACKVNGPRKATCVLPRGHSGYHEGNGCDEYGPMYCSWAARRG